MSNSKKVQHPSGGVVGEILARDGDRVKAGDIIVRLDETIARANLAIVEKSLVELQARKARLEAERDESAGIRFPDSLTRQAARDADVDRALASERTLFEQRRKARSGQKSVLKERAAQLEQEIDGNLRQAESKQNEIGFVKKELEGANELWAKKLIPITKVTALQREEQRLGGERAQLISRVAQARGKIGEIALEAIQIDRDLASEVSKEMREIEAKIGEMVERKVAAEDQAKRIEIRAPQDGFVHQSAVHTIGGVVTPGEVMMLIVPEQERLMVEARVAPQSIDRVWIGQSTRLRFTNFDRRTTPEIDGKVELIRSRRERRSAHRRQVLHCPCGADQAKRLGEVALLPGMPVEVMIETGERTAISYLTKPLRDQINLAFRER